MTQLNDDNFLTIGDLSNNSACLVWLHGYGANNWSFEPSMKLINMLLDEKLFIIIPNAPIVDGKRSWYPLPINHEKGITEDYKGLCDSQTGVCNLIKRHAKESNLFIGGFSQGAALSLSLLFSKFINIKGCIALSGYMPNADIYNDMEIQDAEIFMAHGYKDKAILFKSYEKSISFIKSKTEKITTYTGDFGHTITEEVTDSLVSWLKDKI
tara:strand:+ start:6921 stop:7553 length:633 start_codon:yes stop_codon:yes gene_type:complete